MDYFYVYQNKTYHEEFNGSFLWSPQYANGGRKNAGYEMMKEVRKGDIIFHSYQGEIVAISIAQSSCYSSPRPSSAFSMWAHNGWKIDTKYLALPTSLKTEPFIPTLYGMQPPKGPYTATFRGKQQYLCKANKEMFDFLMKEILAVQLSTAVQNQIKNFVK